MMTSTFTKYFAAALTLAATSLSSFGVSAMPIDVFQDNVKMGTIEAYSGAASASANWSTNNGPAIGPTGIEDTGQLFFYDSGVDGLTFNIMWNTKPSGGSSRVKWNIDVAGSTSDAVVLESDDATEFRETATNDKFYGDWRWGGLYDGGIIGGLTGAWEITIDPVSYSNIAGLYAVDSSGASTALALNANTNIVLKQSVSVPEPASALLLGLGMIGFAVRRKK